MAVKQHQLQWPCQLSWSSVYRIACRCESPLGHLHDPGCGRTSSSLSNARDAACICSLIANRCEGMRIPTFLRALSDQASDGLCIFTCLKASTSLICAFFELRLIEGNAYFK